MRKVVHSLLGLLPAGWLPKRAREIGVDEYRQLSILEQTNMSEVWLARRRSDQLVTVTKIARVDKPQFIEPNQDAIRNEALWLHKFRGNPRIVQIYCTGETLLPGKPRFIAAEYLDGGTVEDLVEQKSLLGWINHRLVSLNPWSTTPNHDEEEPNLLSLIGVPRRYLYKGPIPVEQALELIHYIAHGLAQIHGKGVVHRDIKPDNIMFRQRPRRGQSISAGNLVIIDLGIATAENQITGAAVALGWSEPRRIHARNAHKPLVIRSGFDIYCLGKIIRYMLTQEKPFLISEAELRVPIQPSQLRSRSRLSDSKRVWAARELTQLMNDCLRERAEDRPSAQIIVRRAEVLLRLLEPNHSTEGKLVPAEIIADAQQKMTLRFRRYGLVGSLVLTLIAAGLGLALWQNSVSLRDQQNQFGSNLLAQSPSSPSPSPPLSPADKSPPRSNSGVATALAMATATSRATSTPLHLADVADGPSTGPPTSTPLTLTRSAFSASNGSSSPNRDNPTLIATQTASPETSQRPQPEPSPTRKTRPTQSPHSKPVVQLSSAGNELTSLTSELTSFDSDALTVYVLAGLNGCRTDSVATWDERVELQWVLEPLGVSLPEGLALEVVVWPPGADVLDPNQAFTIHGREEIGVADGVYTLRRKLKNLIPTVIQRNKEYLWGIVLVDSQNGLRHKRLTPADCRFRPAEHLFGPSQQDRSGEESQP